ncbi:MAG TPA: TolC family protein [Terracidiphilus sp.]|nr:TolC family protein [Terracidiphilus sp.]
MSGLSMTHELTLQSCARVSAAVLGLGLLLPAPAVRGQAAAQAADAGTPVVISLDEAIKRAQANEPALAAARAASQSAALDRSIARAGLLPDARFVSQGIYTQPNGTYADSGEGITTPNPRFVANDTRPREYINQGIVEETLSVAGAAAVRRADAAAAVARAELEIARRGLVATVTGQFYGSLAADHKVEIAQRAYQEAEDFTRITTDREQQREAAHADVVKAQLTEQQQWRSLQDAVLAAQTARLDLGVLLFADPRTPYTLKPPETVPPLPPFSDVETAAAKYSPEMKSALANLDETNADVLGARGALMPTLGLNVIYGIDANQFALNGPLTPDGVKARNLGYSTSFTVNLPVWDWLSTQHKLKQSEIRRDAARVALTAAQRQLIADLQIDYAAAQTARGELESLDQSVAAASESLRLSKLRYKSGEAQVLEVVDAQNAYVTAQNQREDGYVHYRTARAALESLTGTL